MKIIPVRSEGSNSTVTVIKHVIEAPGPHGMSTAELRGRLRILDLIEKVTQNDEIRIEDTDYSVLVDAFNRTAWGQVDKGLLQIIDDVLGATAPPEA